MLSSIGIFVPPGVYVLYMVHWCPPWRSTMYVEFQFNSKMTQEVRDKLK